MIARYETKVGPKGRNIDYAKPVTVYASSVAEANTKAVQLGWSGDGRDAVVWTLSVEEILHE